MKKKDQVSGRSWKFYDDIAHFYDSQYEEPYWKLYHLVTEKLIESLIKKHFGGRNGLSVLDLGSGTGFWAEYFLLGENKVSLLEPSEKMLEIAKEKISLFEFNPEMVSFYNGIAENLPFTNSSFDIVNAQGDVLSYVMDIDSAFKEINRVLKNGGILVGSVDNFYSFLNDSLSELDFNRAEEICLKKKAVIGEARYSKTFFETRLFESETITAFAKKYGFDILEIAGKVVFGPYLEKELFRNLEKAAEKELEFCRKNELLYRAEHLHFAMKKASSSFLP